MTELEEKPTEAMLDKIVYPRQREEGSKLPQYLFTIAAMMSGFCAGTAIAWSGPALVIIVESANHTNEGAPFTITAEQGSWVASLLPVGGLVGALLAGQLSNIFGRKRVCAFLAVPFFVSWIIIVSTSSASALYVARLIVGLAAGASTVIPSIYVVEIAENSVRGTLGTFLQLALTSGNLFTFILGACVNYTKLALINGILPIIFILFFFRAPETPAYLLRKGLRQEAEASLRRLRGSVYNVSQEISELQKEIDSYSSTTKASFSDMFTRKPAFRAFIICMGLVIFQQLSGVNAIFFYVNSILRDAGSTISPEWSVIIIGVIQVVVSYMSSLLVDKAGRRILLLISGSVMACCQGMLGYYFYLKDSGSDVSSLNLIPIGSVSLFIVVFCLGFGPIPWMMTGELFTSDLKGHAVSMAVGVDWFLAFLVTNMFTSVKNMLGMGITLGICSIICIISVPFVFLWVPETKGKSTEQIQGILAGNKKSPVLL